MKIILASNSPRRQQLLKQLGFSFQTISIDHNEQYPTDIPTTEIAKYIATQKSKAYNTLKQNEILITADTIVVINNQILGKPKNQQQATEMLKKLSGNTHQVHTAVCIRTIQKNITIVDTAQVTIEPLTDKEIQYYITQHTPLDKAGSYGIQDWIGLAKISKIQGNYYTIMGLPTHLVYTHLTNIISEIQKNTTQNN